MLFKQQFLSRFLSVPQTARILMFVTYSTEDPKLKLRFPRLHAGCGNISKDFLPKWINMKLEIQVYRRILSAKVRFAQLVWIRSLLHYHDLFVGIFTIT